MKGKTIKLAIDTGAYDLGPVPPATRVTIEAGCLRGKEMRARLREALIENKDNDARNRATMERIAEHAVVSWSLAPSPAGFPEQLDRAAVAAFLIALYDAHEEAALALTMALTDAKRFGLPVLVDPEALGEG